MFISPLKLPYRKLVKANYGFTGPRFHLAVTYKA